MKHFKHILIPIFILTTYLSYSQENNDHWRMTNEQAKSIVKETLKDLTLHNVIGNKSILTTEKKVIEFAKFILFDIYGKKNIVNQKPYDVFLIDEYWLISGTLPKGTLGGTFMMMIDSKNYKIVRLTHGK
jgi:NTF2 fold immunity protein of polymorphic toxin system component